MGYIIFVGAGYPIIRITEMSYPVLRGNTSVKIKKLRKVKTKVEKVDTENISLDLLNMLKELRTEIARKKGVPAYLIFSDATLADMCRKMPATNDEFLTVNGVGNNKLEKYGERFMSVIEEWNLLQ